MYRWKSQGVVKLPRNNPLVKRMYFNVDTPHGQSKNFQRNAYQLLSNPLLTLIHYHGDEDVAVDFPHRGSTSDKIHIRTSSSYLSKCKELVKSNQANVVYKKEVSSGSGDLVSMPRNMKQLRNLRFEHLSNCRISQDALYNLHEIAYDIPGFVWRITSFPDLVCIIGLQEVLNEMDRVLLLETNNQLISYDTTFQLGDFYVSPLIFKHTLFEGCPCIPAMFLIHERKFTETHEEMFKECCKRIPSLKSTKCPLVVDREKAITKAIQQQLPSSILILYCWNHIFRDVRSWCSKHGAPKADISLYLDHLFELFHQPSLSEYNKKLEEKRLIWDSAFEDYYMNEVNSNVIESAGRWVLEKFSLYNPYSGITNNQRQ